VALTPGCWFIRWLFSYVMRCRLVSSNHIINVEYLFRRKKLQIWIFVNCVIVRDISNTAFPSFFSIRIKIIQGGYSFISIKICRIIVVAMHPSRIFFSFISGDYVTDKQQNLYALCLTLCLRNLDYISTSKNLFLWKPIENKIQKM